MPTACQMWRVVLSTLRTPTEKLQGMTFNRKLRLSLDEFGQLLYGAQHQIDDEAAATALNVMMVLSAMAHFITHLPFMEPNRIHQTKLLQHRQVSIDRHKISGNMGLLQPFMDLRYCNGKGAPLQNGKNRLPRFREFLAAGSKTVKN